MFPVLFTFYIQSVLKLKNNSGAKRLNHARRHFERNLVQGVHHRSVASKNWFKKLETGEADVTPADFFLWGPIEGQSLQKYTPHTMEQLKDAIRQEIQAVNAEILRKVFQNLEKRIPVCLDVKGDQF